MSKKFIIEISKLDPDGVPTLDQWVKRALVGTCTAPIVIGGQSYDGWVMAGRKIDGEVAELATEVDEEWRSGIEATLGKELVVRGVERVWSGVIVFELARYGRNGILVFAGPRRFYIFKIGSECALYCSDSIADAFSEARKIYQRIPVDESRLRSLPVPAPNSC